MSFGFGLSLPSWQALSGGFSPASLFQGGTVAGAWYDPSDLSTMFDTSAGTTPVAMPGQGAAVPVGLMLDKSQGLVLGSELVSAPFTDSAIWLDVVSNITNRTATSFTTSGTGGVQLGGSGSIVQNNKRYRVAITWTKSDATTAFSVRMQTGIDAISSTAASGVFLLNENVINGTVYLRLSAAATLTITSISVRELPGNHAIAFNNTTARPELRARVNELLSTEDLTTANWAPTGVASRTASASTATLPTGQNVSLTRVVEDSGNTAHRVSSASGISPISGTTYNARAVIKGGGVRDWLYLRVEDTASNFLWFNATTGATGTVSAGLSNVSVVSLGGGAWLVSCTRVVSGTSLQMLIGHAAANNLPIYTGDGSAWFESGGADLRPANIGANVPAYQRIADANTYDTNGFPLYLRFDGIDDSMYTPASIPFATVTSDGQARRNLLLNPTQFDVSTVWDTSSGSVTVTANTTTSPDGSVTADTLTENTANSVHAVFQLSALGAAGLNTFSVYAKASTRSWVVLRVDGASTFFDVGTGAVGTVGSGCTASITNVGNGWYRCVVSKTWAANNNCWIRLATGNGVESYTGDGTSGLYIWGAQLELGSAATAFQNIGTDKVAVFAGVRKLSDAAAGILAELSADWNSNAGTFISVAPDATGASGDYLAASRGTAAANVNQFARSAITLAPVTNVVTATHDIPGDLSALRLNGAASGTNGTGDKGSGNFGTYPLFIGSRNNSIARLNGHLYSLIIAGSAVSAGNISATESWVAGRTGIQI